MSICNLDNDAVQMDIPQTQDRPAAYSGMEVPFTNQSGKCITYGFNSTNGLAFLIIVNYKYISLNEKYN